MPPFASELHHLSASDELVLDKRLEPGSVARSLVLAVLLVALLALPYLVRPAVVEVVRVATMTFGGSTSMNPGESGPGLTRIA
jgi:hypothetical protein